MKTINFFISSLLCFSMLFLNSCNKEESILTGRLTYKGAVTGIEYTAPNTTIYLHLGSPDAAPYSSVTTDSDGYYQFQGLWKAHWYISSSTTVNLINYSGSTGTTAIDGKNVITLNLMME
jgi:hypothetical protein